jgi:hypothetical protein
VSSFHTVRPAAGITLAIDVNFIAHMTHWLERRY